MIFCGTSPVVVSCFSLSMLQVARGRRLRQTQDFFMAKRVIASYCSSFLKPEMLHIYRQVKALRRVKTFIMTKELQNAERFPFRDIEVIPRRRMNLLRHGWLKVVERRPAIGYTGEYQTLDALL